MRDAGRCRGVGALLVLSFQVTLLSSAAEASLVAAGPVAVDAGRGFACGLGAGGELYCWGSNSRGQLGIGFTFEVRDVSAPQRVAESLGTFTAVSAGAEHACAIAGGALYCWGANGRGQLGDGTITNRASPVRIGTSVDWTAVSASVTHTCGLRGNALFCWGSNGSGELGIGTFTEQYGPRAVPGSFDSVATGEAHTCAIESGTRSLYCFGNNFVGQLGLSGIESRPSPNLISAAPHTDVDAGGGHTCAIRSDGSLWCSGLNNSGQLGDGTLKHALLFRGCRKRF